MINFRDFCVNQKIIYDRDFRGSEGVVRQQGVENGLVGNRGVTGGYYIVYRHNEEVMKFLEGRLALIAGTLPPGCAVVYPKEEFHVTASDFGIEPRDKFSSNDGILREIDFAIGGILPKIRAPAVNLGEILYNRTSIIAEGFPDQAYIDSTNEVLRSCRSAGIELRNPWGAHTTLLRFKVKTDAEKLAEFFHRMTNVKPLGIASRLEYLEFGDFIFDRSSLHHNTYRRFKLRTK